MTTRILPPEEWGRLEGTYLGPAQSVLQTDSCTVVVVEDAGEIVGTWALLPMWHVEGFSAKNGAVLRALVRGMKAETDARGLGKVITGAADPLIDQFVRRVDPEAQVMPGIQYVWTLPTF